MSDAVAWHDARAERFEAAYDRSPRFRERLQVWSAAMAPWLGPGVTVLDAGCGTGVLGEVAAAGGARVLAFDPSPQMAARARLRLGAPHEVREMRLEEAARLGQGGFDLVLCSSVLEYVEDLDRALATLAGALAAGGALMVSTPNGLSLYRLAERILFGLTRRPRYFAHVRHAPTPRQLSRRLEALGLEGVEQSFYGCVPLLSRGARALGRPALADTLVLTVARRPLPAPRAGG